MWKVQLKISPFFGYLMHQSSSDWIIVEVEIGKQTSIGDLLNDLALINSEFRASVFNPETGIVGSQIDIVVNQTLLHFPSEMSTRLHNGDIIILLPVNTGG